MIKNLLLLFTLFTITFGLQGQTQVKWASDLLISGVQSELVFTNPTYEDTTVLADLGETMAELHFVNGLAKTQLEAQDLITVKVGQEDRLTHERTTLPLWLSIIPPLFAIGMALITREVVSSLLTGIIAGGMILGIYLSGWLGLITGITRTIDHYILDAMTDSGHVSVIIFSVLIGGMVTVISKNGGMQGIVNKLSHKARDPKSGQMVTYVLGLAIFFDDYANTLVVGNTMRAITDKLKISREKLAYLVDSTAAPLAAIAFVTTWIGAELGYISDGVEQIESSLGVTILEGAYNIFLNSLQYSFYPILTLLFILILIIKQKDFGPMLMAEKKARKHGVTEQSSTGAEDEEFTMHPNAKAKPYRAIIPVLIVILGTIVGLFITGYSAEVWNNVELGFGKKLSQTIGASDSYTALLWSSSISLISAILLSLNIPGVKLNTVIEWSISGFKTMLNAVIILVLAWALAGVTKELHTANFLTASLGSWLPVFLIPAFTFILAALVAFATGSSWGTMAIIYPLVLPLAWMLSQMEGYEYAETMGVFSHVVACVLAGAVLGDHCSPISDTTILSSLASRCNHLDHVKTQMPYALTVGGVSVVFCSIPAALGVSPWLTMVVGVAVLYFIIHQFGKKSV